MSNVFTQNIKFLKAYRFPGMNGGLGACRTSDGGIAITGQHESGHCKVYIAKINKCGALQWYKIYDFGHSAGGLSITEAYDGGLIVAGAADLTASGYDWLVMKTDANGNLLWHDLWRNVPLASRTEWAQSVCELPNHNIVAVGGTAMWWGEPNDACISFYASNGTYLFTKKLAGSGYDMFNSVTTDGTYIWAQGVTTSFGAGGMDIFVVKMDMSGNVLWIKTYGTNQKDGWQDDSFHKCYPTSDGGLLIATRITATAGHPLLAGGGNMNSMLIKIDKNGNLQWAKTYGFGAGWDNYTMALTVSQSKKIAVVGATYGTFVQGGREAFLAILDSNGVVIQNNGYGFPNSDSYIQIFNYGSNRFMVVGNTQNGGGGDYDPFIAVTDSLGQCGTCPNSAIISAPYKDITSSVSTTTISPLIYWQTHNISQYSQLPTVNSVNPTDNFVCTTCSAIAPTFTVNKSNLCVGDTLKITNTTPNNDACLEWFVNTVPINPSTNDTSIVYTTPGTYTLSMQTTCGTTVLVATQTVQVYAPFSITANTNSVSCAGGTNGSATVNVSGGMPPYNYLWTPSAQTSSVLSGVPTGNYTVTVSDQGACGSTFTTVNIPQPISSPSIVIMQTHSISCNGANDGSVAVNAYGGTGSITYSWSPGGMTTPTVTNLSPGTYTIEVFDANNCTASATLQINEPPAVSVSVSSGSVSCNGGSDGWVSATATGGSGGYSYTWTPVNVNNSYVSNLPVGNYTVSVKDLNGCFISATVSVIQPPALSISAVSNSATCYGIPTGSGTVTVGGGVGGYQYQWLPVGGSQSVATNLPGGQYTISVLDANQCPISTTLLVQQPSSITLMVAPDATVCYGNSISLFANATGGTAPYTYAWNNGNNGPGPFSVSPISTSFYNVYVTDANNCTSETKTIKITVLPSITVVPTLTSVCDKDTVVLSAYYYGGNGGPYTLNWSTGASSATLMVVGDYAQTPMTFTLNVSDGCTNPDGIGVFTVNVNPLPVLNFVANPLSGCVPLKVNFNATAGSSLDSYAWDFGNGQSAFTNPAEVIYGTVGTFDIKLAVTTMFGCYRDTTVTNFIQTYSVPIASFYPDKPVLSELDGEIHFINTSVGGVTYFWNFGDSTSINNTASSFNAVHLYAVPKDYTVSLVVTNVFGCSDTTYQRITVRPDVAIYIPNVFTPDADGLNDVFKPAGVGLQNLNYKMQIFDRWGNLIFTSEDFNEGWDGTYKGKPVPVGVYAYYIVVYDIKGYKHFYKGHVSVLTNKK
jgi:gliding motility-associated-like protein